MKFKSANAFSSSGFNSNPICPKFDRMLKNMYPIILWIMKYDFVGSFVAFQLSVIFHKVYGAIPPNNAKPINAAKKIMAKH
nr:hypothetical protein [Paenibacillus sp. N3.4]